VAKKKKHDPYKNLDLKNPPPPRRTAKDKKMKKLLVKLDNCNPERDIYHTMTASEFTSFCRAMGQPDYATVIITMVPDKEVIELKSLKMYLQAFRDIDVYMEELPNWILDDLVEFSKPRFLEVKVEYNARGGIQSTVTVSYDQTFGAHSEYNDD
jgi:7-cyano-7-deazaguanine reductase